jgi:MoxR-like ATPase
LLLPPLRAGKTALARALAALAGQPLAELALTPGTDTADLLGSFEQLQPRRALQVRTHALARE